MEILGSRSQWLTLPNMLSISRVPLGLLLFAYASPGLRFSLIVCAALTDFLDGWLARRWNQTSPLGEWLDPLGDKVFAACAIGVGWLEGVLTPYAVLALLSREGALLAHLAYSSFRKARGQPVVWMVGTSASSKWFTACQMVCVALLTLGYELPTFFYGGMIGVGTAIAWEWVQRGRRLANTTTLVEA